MQYAIEYAGVSIKGLLRKNNEDNIWCNGSFLPIIHTDDYKDLSGETTISKKWFAVFDGMGGEASGEVASHVASKVFGIEIQKESEIQTICNEMNKAVNKYADKNHILSMGTTIAAVGFDKEEIVCFNIGDSRCYKFSNGNLKRMSVDHISPYRKNALTKCIGMDEKELIPSCFFADYQKDDIFLLCTDGLTKIISDDWIQRILSTRGSAADKMIKLKDIALKRGAPDDTTFIIIKIKEKSRMELFTSIICNLF